MYFGFPTWAKSLAKFYPQIQDFKRVLDLSLSKGKTHLFDCFNWLSILKNSVILNGSKNVRNVIQTVLNSYFFPKKNSKTSPAAAPRLWSVKRLN